MRGGPLLGRQAAGCYDTFVGETTRYVVNKAPCRVILTAPPGDDRAPPAPEPPSARHGRVDPMRCPASRRDRGISIRSGRAAAS